MKFTFYLLILFLASSSCQEKKEQNKNPRLATDTLQIAFTPQKKAEIQLINTAREALKLWEIFSNVEADIKTLDTVSLQYLRLNKENYITNATLALTKVEDSLVNNAIKARLTVLFSKTNTLTQEASKIVVDTALVNKEGTELYNAFQNLKLQLNLKYQQSIEELLEKYEIEADSLSAVRDSLDTRKPVPAQGNTLKRTNN